MVLLLSSDLCRVLRIDIRGAVKTLVVQQRDYFIERPCPEAPKAGVASKHSYKRRADFVIARDKSAAIPLFSQNIIPETAECPYLGAIIRAIHTGRYVAALGGRLVIVSAKHTRIAGASALVFCVIVVIAAEQARIAVAYLFSFVVVMGVATEQARIAASNLFSAGIIVRISTEQTGMALANLMTLAVIVVYVTKQPRAAISLFIGHINSPFPLILVCCHRQVTVSFPPPGIILTDVPVVSNILLEEGRLDLTLLIGKHTHLPGLLDFLCNVGGLQQLGKGIVLSLHTCIVEWECPLGKDNLIFQIMPLRVNAHQSQRIAAHDVPIKDKLCCPLCFFAALSLADSFVFLIPYFIQALLAGNHIVQQNIDTIKAAEGQ